MVIAGVVVRTPLLCNCVWCAVVLGGGGGEKLVAGKFVYIEMHIHVDVCRALLRNH